MTKFYSFTTRLAALVCLFVMICPQADAKWKLFKKLDATHSFHITKGGTMLVSDYNYDRKGGIWYSTDKGETWVKADIADYNYNKFVELDDYVFALGYSGRIARSDDEGKTWELLNYTAPLKGIIPTADLESDACYGMAYHNGKLFIADFVGGGVLYSEDMGETWNLTDRNPMSFTVSDQKDGLPTTSVEAIYNLMSFNGELYAFGLYCVYKYLEDTNSWENVRDDSNFMSVETIHKGKMFCGRSMPNETEASPFLEWTEDGVYWNWTERPVGQIDNNVRAMGQDENNLYVGLQTRGIYYSNDGGTSWADITEGLPFLNVYVNDQYLSPLQIVADDEYVYVAVFEMMFSNRHVSGVYRQAKSELPEPVTSIEDLVQQRANHIYADEAYLHFEGNARVKVTDTAGKEQHVAVEPGRADIRNLEKGVYVFEIIDAEGGRLTGKFLKK